MLKDTNFSPPWHHGDGGRGGEGQWSDGPRLGAGACAEGHQFLPTMPSW